MRTFIAALALTWLIILFYDVARLYHAGRQS